LEDEEDEDEILLQRMKSSQNNNAILNYLQLYRGIDLDKALDEDQQLQSILFTSLIQNDLEPCLVALRYGDGDAWEQIYRDQCRRAGTYGGASHHHPNDGSNSTQSWWWSRIHPLASWQAWSERRQALSNGNHRSFRSTQHALATARQAYQVLEHQLLQKQTAQATSTSNNNPNSVSYLLGTHQPAVVDCLLWDHLMQALTDIYLVVVLADFPQLLHYTQRLWDDYHFGVAVDNDKDGKSLSSVSVWNLEENALNAFNEVPLLPPRRQHPSSEEPLQQQHAVDLMKKLSVCHLPESLLLAQKTRQQDDEHTPSSKRRPLATWHRWRMGGPCWPTPPPPSSQQRAKPSSTSAGTGTARPADAAAQQEERIQRDYQRNDEIWLAGVAATTLAVVLGFGFSGGGGGSGSRQ